MLFAITILLLREASFLPNGTTQLVFFDVGQGDSALIISPFRKTILIDGGPNLTTLEYLGKRLSFFERTIDVLVLSHPNLDHLASFPEILKRYSVKNILLPAIDFDLPRYHQFLALALEKNVRILPAQSGTTIAIDKNLSIDILWPRQPWSGSNENNASIVFRVRNQNNSALFTGDIERSAEQELLALGYNLRSDILKVPHHGSKSSTSTGFLLAVQPTTAVISAGKNNRFSHPHKEVSQRLDHFKIRTFQTGTDGTVEIKWK